MKRTLRTLLAVLTVLVALAAASSVLYRLSQARQSGERLAGAEYSVLRNSLSSVPDQSYLADPFLRERLISLYRGSPRLIAAQVLDSSGLPVWKVPADSPHFASPDNTSARGGFDAPRLSTVVLSTPLSGGMRLSALYASVLQSDFSSAVRIAAIFLGIWLLIAIVGAILLQKAGHAPQDNGGDKNTDRDDRSAAPEEGTLAGLPDVQDVAIEKTEEEFEAAEDENESLDEPMDEDVDEPETLEELDDQEEPDVDDLSDELEPEEEIDESYAEEDLSENLADETLEETLQSEQVPEPAVEPAAATVSSVSSASSDDANTAGVPGPATASAAPAVAAAAAAAASASAAASLTSATLGRPTEDGPDLELETRLSEELRRGDLSDLSLVLVKCETTGPHDPAVPALAASVKDYFSIRDLVFERGKGEFALVLPGLDMGKAMRMSEDLADVLAATLSLYRDIEGAAPVFIGLSSRSGRAVDALRLYKEADAALVRASSGVPSRILAFRPDPKKYEALMSAKRQA